MGTIEQPIREQSVKTRALAEESVTVELTEFELTALVALVERGQKGLRPRHGEREIHRAIHKVATEFRSLLGHFELTNSAAND